MSYALWVAIAVGAYMAWNIGANDVANSMGTSVGSKAIKLKTAMWVAAIMNFLGAYLVGPNVSGTVRGKIVDPAIFTDINIFILGMLAALLASAIWLNIATYLGWPVSTTHSIIGAILGFGLITHGVAAVNWIVTLKIVASWVISPVSGGVIAALVFLVIIRLIFFAKNPIEAAKRWVPWIISGTVAIIILSLFYKGLKHLHLIQSSSDPTALLPWWSTFVIAIVGAIIAYFLGKLWMGTIPVVDDELTRTQKFKVVEKIFAKLQVASACYVAFAHGANDVANAIGPVSAVVEAINSGAIDAKTPVQIELLLGGGIFIGAGIIIWGWRVIKTIGEKITSITPSRGFAAEFGAATTVLMCSQMGLPISTTHTLVGAVIGVGFARGMKALDLGIIRKIVESWVYTIPFTAILTIIIFFLLKTFCYSS